jgi:UDP-N-acetylmuramate dehydrogenase
MALPPTVAADLLAAGVPLVADMPLARKTWWRVGGPADGWAEIGDAAVLSAALGICARAGVPVFPLGNASNLLIGDGGIRGLVVRLTEGLATVTADDADPPELTVGGGLRLVSLLGRAQREGWTGLEMLAGVPGTIGGAIRMNAGTRLGEIAAALRAVEVLGPDGTPATLPVAALAMSYRHAELPPGAIVVGARLATTGTDPDESAEKIAEHLEYRAQTQPVDVPTCGSTFRNPPGDSAGRLLEAAGLKGFRVGAAEVSPKHANFVVNLGGATAADIRAVIDEMIRRVRDHAGVTLVPEVHFVGEPV